MDGEDQSEGGQVVVSSLFNGEWKDRHCVVRDCSEGWRGEGSLSVLVRPVSISEHDSEDRRVKARWFCGTGFECIHDERRVAGGGDADHVY